MQNRSINIYYSDTVVTGDDMLHVSRSGGWNKVEVYPVDHDGEAIKISASFTFFCKIAFKRTPFLKWMMGKRR